MQSVYCLTYGWLWSSFPWLLPNQVEALQNYDHSLDLIHVSLWVFLWHPPVCFEVSGRFALKPIVPPNLLDRTFWRLLKCSQEVGWGQWHQLRCRLLLSYEPQSETWQAFLYRFYFHHCALFWYEGSVNLRYRILSDNFSMGKWRIESFLLPCVCCVSFGLISKA